MTATAGEQRARGIGHRLPSAQVAQLLGVLDEISHPTHGGHADLAALADALDLEVDDLFPIIEALQLLEFAEVAEGDIRLTPHGQAFIDADIRRRKMIFGEHLLRRVHWPGTSAG